MKVGKLILAVGLTCLMVIITVFCIRMISSIDFSKKEVPTKAAVQESQIPVSDSAYLLDSGDSWFDIVVVVTSKNTLPFEIPEPTTYSDGEHQITTPVKVFYELHVTDGKETDVFDVTKAEYEAIQPGTFLNAYKHIHGSIVELQPQKGGLFDNESHGTLLDQIITKR